MTKMIKKTNEFYLGLVVMFLSFTIGIYFFSNITTKYIGGLFGSLSGLGLVYGFKMVYDSFNRKTENSPMFRTMLVVSIGSVILVWLLVFYKALTPQ